MHFHGLNFVPASENKTKYDTDDDLDQLYCNGQFYWCKKAEYPAKTSKLLLRV